MRLSFVFALALVGCSTRNNTFDDGGDTPDSGPTEDAVVADTTFNPGDAMLPDASSMQVIYANSDTDLYVMEPKSLTVVKIGPFDDGSGAAPTITDLAVNQAGDVYVNSVDTLFKAAVPKTPGKVALTKIDTIKGKTNQRFYALGFTPPNVLGAAEMLVGADSAGEVYAIDMTGNTTLLGTFGPDGNGGVYGISGDIQFYMQNGKPRGLATVRPHKNGQATTTNNDIVAEIDVAALTTAWNTKTPQPLKKQFLGSGTMFGRLYGIGAWDDSVFAFQRVGSNNYPATLVKIGANGSGQSIQTFPMIAAGWSGAGVTTTAPVTILPPN